MINGFVERNPATESICLPVPAVHSNWRKGLAPSECSINGKSPPPALWKQRYKWRFRSSFWRGNRFPSSSKPRMAFLGLFPLLDFQAPSISIFPRLLIVSNTFTHFKNKLKNQNHLLDPVCLQSPPPHSQAFWEIKACFHYSHTHFLIYHSFFPADGLPPRWPGQRPFVAI